MPLVLSLLKAAINNARNHSSPLSPVTVVVGNAAAGLNARRALTLRDDGSPGAGLTNIRFVSLRTLAEAILDASAPQLVPPRETEFDAVVRKWNLRKILLEMGEPFSTSANPASVNTLDRLFKLMAQRTIHPLETDQWWVAAYEASLEAKLYTQGDLLGLAEQVLAEGGQVPADFGQLILWQPPSRDPGGIKLVKELLTQGAGPAWPTIEPTESKPEVRLCSDPTTESHSVVNWLIRQLQEGIPLWKMGVAVPPGSGYLNLLRQALDRADVPYSFSAPVQLKQTRAGQLVQATIDVFGGDFEWEAHDRWLYLADFATLADGGPSSEADLRDLRQSLKIRSGSSRLLAALARKGDSSVAVKLASITEELLKSSRDFDSAGSWQEASEPLLQILSRYGDRSDAEKVLTERLGDLGQLDELGAYQKGDLNSILPYLLGLTMEDRVAFGNGVFIGPISAVSAMALDAVAVVGMAEGAYPETEPNQALLARWAPNLIENTQNALDGSEDAFSNLARSTSRLLYSYAESEPGSFGGLSPSQKFLAAASQWSQEPVTFKNYRSQIRPEDISPSFISQLYDDWPASDAIEAFQKFSNEASPLKRSLLHLPEGVEIDSLTATDAEAAFECPARYFYKSILGLKDQRDPEPDGIGPDKIGQMIHLALSAALLKKDASEVRRVMTETFARMVQNGEIVDEPLTRAEVESRIQIAAEVADSEIARLSQLRREIVATEFQIEQEIPSLGLTIRGRIDRIDNGPRQQTIVDYKSGSRPENALVEKIQIALYADALVRQTNKPWPEGEYVYLKSFPNPKYVDPRDSESSNQSLDRFSAVLETMRRGDFPLVPGKELNGKLTHCGYCQFNPICPSSRVAQFDELFNGERLPSIQPIYKPRNADEGEEVGEE